jgi:hypothetical protein
LAETLSEQLLSGSGEQVEWPLELEKLELQEQLTLESAAHHHHHRRRRLL